MWSNTRALYRADYIIIPFYIALYYNAYIGKLIIYGLVFLYFYLIYYFCVLSPRRKMPLITKLDMRVFISLHIFGITVILLVL